MSQPLRDECWFMIALVGLWIAIIAIAWAIVAFSVGKASAQEHQHPTETITGATGEFYARWDRIDMPGSSCCSAQDCYAAPARMVGGTWFFLRREDEHWVAVPHQKIETRYDSPDGRAHVCASPPGTNIVYCFLPAGGA